MRLALALVVVAACNSAHAITGDAPPADIYEPVDATLAVTSIALTPPTATIAWPDTQPLAVTAHYTDDATMDVTIYADYTSDTPSVATVAEGSVRSRGPGTATITASYMGETSTMTVTVTSPTLAVASPDGVDFFDASAQGTPAPTHSIRGAATTIQHACCVAVLGTEIFVGDDVANAIDVWPIAASGNVAPSRRITTSFTPVSLATAGTSIFVGAVDGVRVFASTGSGAATPVQTIAGSATTITSGAGIAVYQGNLYVVSQPAAIAVFPTTANGNVAPARVLAGANTGLANATGIAVGFGFEVVTEAMTEGAAQVYFPAQSGNTLPAGVISGDQTLLATPTSAALVDTMVFIGTPSTSSIEVFPTTTNGEFPPAETIGGVSVQAMVIF